MIHFCTNSQVDEAPPKPEPNEMAIRDAVLGLWGVTRFCQTFPKCFSKIRSLELLTHYAIEVPTRRKRVPMDVPYMVEQWRAVIVTLCTAHDKEAIDKAEYRMDELLTPILTAPVAQLREFYTGITDALKADKQVPFFIWSMFKTWGRIVVDKCEDRADVRKLRRKLASEIAEMVEPDIQPDITAALVGALMWRDPKDLEEIKGDLKAGARPSLRGRESCLFLVTTKGRGKKATEHTVML